MDSLFAIIISILDLRNLILQGREAFWIVKVYGTEEQLGQAKDLGRTIRKCRLEGHVAWGQGALIRLIVLATEVAHNEMCRDLGRCEGWSAEDYAERQMVLDNLQDFILGLDHPDGPDA